MTSRLWSSEPYQQAEIGQITDKAFWNQIGKDLGVPKEEIITFRQEIWTTWVVNQTLLGQIDQLGVNHRIAMLSNAPDALPNILDTQYAIADRFEFILTSAKLGQAKPATEAFEALLKKLKLDAKEVVFVDDRAENIAAAAAMGMHVIWYVCPSEFGRQMAVYLNKERHKPALSEGLAEAAE